MQLLTPALLVAESEGHSEVTASDIDQVDSLFFDAKTSAKRLLADAHKYVT